MFAESYGDFFGYPDDFDSLVDGIRVGPMREVVLKFSCTATQPTWFGVGTRKITGTIQTAITPQTTVNPDVIYTNPVLENFGLGYNVWWHQMYRPTEWGAAKTNTNWSNDEVPYLHTHTSYYIANGVGSFTMLVPVRVRFYKINNNFQNTNGTHIPANIITPLLRFYVARADTPTVTAGTVYTYTLNLNSFSSVKRACTPLVDQTIQFEYITAADLQTHPVGPVEATTKTFDLTFNCPHMAYTNIIFKMHPVHGVIDTTNGVVGIKSGTGYASGIGIQIQARHVIENASTLYNPGFTTTNWLTIKPEPNWYFIPTFAYHIDQIHQNPATANATKIIPFRAHYYRMSGPLTPGKVESAVIFHMIYN